MLGWDWYQLHYERFYLMYSEDFNPPCSRREKCFKIVSLVFVKFIFLIGKCFFCSLYDFLTCYFLNVIKVLLDFLHFIFLPSPSFILSKPGGLHDSVFMTFCISYFYPPHLLSSQNWVACMIQSLWLFAFHIFSLFNSD